MESTYEKIEKKRKLIEKIFMAVILLLFLVFLVLCLKVGSMIPRYIVGAFLLIVALIYKVIDKKLRAEGEKAKKDSGEDR